MTEQEEAEYKDRQHRYNAFVDELQKLTDTYGVAIHAYECVEWVDVRTRRIEYIKDFDASAIVYNR